MSDVTRTWVSRRAAAGLAVWALTMEIGSLVLLVPNSASEGMQQLGFNGMGGIVIGAIYPVIGWLLASRRPGNPIGLLFLAVAVSQAGTAVAWQYAQYGLATNPGSLPFADLATWIGSWSWAPGFVLLLVIVLVFPDGRLPSRRWRPVLWLALVGLAMIVIPNAVGTWSMRGLPLLENESPPAGDPVVALLVTVSAIGNILVLPVGVAAVAGVLVRFRRAGRTEREQIKWFLAAASIEVALLVALGLGLVTLVYPFDIIAAVVVVPLVPIAIAIAVLRYRLYEIDRIVSRTLGWAIVTGMLLAVFAGTVVLLETVLAPVVETSTLAVAASTLVAFALFQPLRRRVQRAVDRRFDRARYDAQQTSDAFARQLRSETDITTVLDSLSSTAAGSMAPRSIDVWLRPKAVTR